MLLLFRLPLHLRLLWASLHSCSYGDRPVRVFCFQLHKCSPISVCRQIAVTKALHPWHRAGNPHASGDEMGWLMRDIYYDVIVVEDAPQSSFRRRGMRLGGGRCIWGLRGRGFLHFLGRNVHSGGHFSPPLLRGSSHSSHKSTSLLAVLFKDPRLTPIPAARPT